MNKFIEKLRKANWKDIAIRASKTFIEAFLSYITIDGIFEITDSSTAKRFVLTTGISALAAGISAVWNLIMEIVSQKVSEELDELAESETNCSGDTAESEESEVVEEGALSEDTAETVWDKK